MATRTAKNTKAKRSSRTVSRGGRAKSAGKGLENLHEAFLAKLGSLMDVEEQIVKALPKMAKKAAEPQLKSGFETHLEQTKGQIDRLKRAFESVGAKPKKVKVDAIRGMIADAEWVLKNAQGKEVRDAAMIAAAQYVEHYEMAGYGTAAEWAKLMGHEEAQRLLEETLQEEKDTDMILNDLAQGGVNEKALRSEAQAG